MDNTRRKFLKNSSVLATAFLLGKQFTSAASSKHSSLSNLHLENVDVLYTSDMHCRLHPFSCGELNNIGGINNIISAIKQNSMSYLLFDAGDFLDKKCSLSDHKNMIGLMNKAGYNAVTLGDKELANGQEYLASLVPMMNYKIVNCNYEFSNLVLKSKIVPYHIISYGQFKIGVTGVGPNIRGKKSAEGITYHHPYKKANEVAAYLKEQLNCDMVICLSHIGIEQKKGQQGNKKLAASSKNIDVIIGGHNKAIVHPQMVLRNREKSQVIIANAAYGGSIIGKLNFTFNQEKKMQLFACKNFIPGTIANSSFYTGYQKLSA
jgi:5'-nucleotidase